MTLHLHMIDQSEHEDPLPTLRLMADIRLSAIKLVPLASPNERVRVEAIKSTEVLHALQTMLLAASKLVLADDEQAYFWRHHREPQGEAEKRFDAIKREMGI